MPDELAILPKPRVLEYREGSFVPGSRVCIAFEGQGAHGVAAYLSRSLEDLGVRTEGGPGDAPRILLAIEPGSLGSEGYELLVGSSEIRLCAAEPRGLFSGCQTLRQMLAEAPEPLPAVRIFDEPRFSWRGMHLDVSRHFFPIDFVKRYVDILAYHKLNTFHWHLTDDQGWRIRIESRPELTELGAWRSENGGRYGGFYGQDEIRELLTHAARRFVTVVPEIEMPGHALAALAAFPELSCTGGPFEVATSWGSQDDVFCAGNEACFEFLEAVLDEVVELFPGPYVHVGGDECSKLRWRECPRCQQRMRAEGLATEDELGRWFINRIAKHLTSRGKRLIGWEEILAPELAEDAVLMPWKSAASGVLAARSGRDVIMSPTSHCYFDHRQSDRDGEPGREEILTLRQVYEFDPVPAELDPSSARHILGGQGNVWTEHIQDEAQVEYMALPRMCALAERLWSSGERDWPDFRSRLEEQLSRLDALGIGYRPLDAP